MFIVLVTFYIIYHNFVDLKNHKEGNEAMQKLAGIIRRGADEFMLHEYKAIGTTVVIVALIYSLFLESTSGLSFIFGALMSSAACFIGMRSGTYANVRTTNAARKTRAMSRTIRIALMGGSVSGFSVQAFGLFGFLVVYLASGGIKVDASGHGLLLNILCNPTTMRLTTYSLGCSVVAMFNRVAGGNYTKAADISADIVGKNMHNLPEDDARNPSTIADFIGDCVNDIAGNVSDLLESFVATPVACILIAAQNFAAMPEVLNSAAIYPVLLAGGGLLSSVVGINYILITNRKRKRGNEEISREDIDPDRKQNVDPEHELNMATYVSAAATLIIGLVGARFVFGSIELPEEFRFGWASPAVAAMLGLVSSVAVGKITEIYTGLKQKPVEKIARMATEGEAFVITKGDAVGSNSVLPPVLVIVSSMVIAGAICGVYGISIAAVGMLANVGETVSIDAFGPIADNAGGIAESCHLDPEVRVITDELDAVGNTTAAIGKGNAIGAAAFATVAFVLSYIGSYPLPDLTDPMITVRIISGAILGGALIEKFIGLLTDNTIDSARELADESEAQLRKMEETGEETDPIKVVRMASKMALRKMTTPSVLALVVPVLSLFVVGPEFTLGLLAGSIIVAITRAIFMGNSGGAWDNAKKYIEAGMLVVLDRFGNVVYGEDGLPKYHEKGQAAHKAAVVGDTTGDTRKDVVGVALDIFIKMMSTVSNTLVPVFYSYHLF
ncbi:sodium/proton-translocating pyrophosphatase [Candidatus Saccharibacteria bacterium]|nr:sodium/proton-translocating pyrophosphatase [Candidatus Saccharibacteria bacterium]